MTRVARHLLALAALVLLLAFPTEAPATPFKVIKDCNQDGVLNGNYSNRDLRGALDNLPSDIDEYSDCRDVIKAAMTSPSGRRGEGAPGGPGGGGPGAGGGPGGGGPGGGAGGAAAPVTPEEQAAQLQDQSDLDALTSPDRRDDGPAVKVGGETVTPGADGMFDVASASNSMPLPLLLALIALGLLALAGAFVGLRGRIPALAQLPLVSKIPKPRVSLPRFGRH
ncbi:MAG: hypothetical protein ICV69_15385 [Thermoleophilaceae bacterium]|nr:hypothetical protein [Thermoleophilaceae bacterium]